MPRTRTAGGLAAPLLMAAAGLCAAPRIASAAPPEHPGPRRGLYLHAAMGPALVTGKVSYSGTTPGSSRRSYSYQDGFAGAGADLSLAAGWAPFNGLALALEGRGILQMTGSAELPTTKLSYLSLQGLGAIVDFYPAPEGPLHVALGAAFARSDSSSEEEAFAAPDNVVHVDDMSGILAHTGVGYDWRAKTGFQVGPVLDVWIARLTSTSGRTNARGASLMISAGWM